MTSPAQSTIQNLLPVQAYFDAQDNFVTFIGQNKPFSATIDPDQSGLNITSSTINSTTIGALVPSTGNFTNISTVTGTISTTPSAATDIANKQYVDYALLGISWKAPAKAATTTNITLSGPQTIDTVSVVAGDTVLVKDQTNPAQNGIYTVQTGAWTYATGSTTWAQYIGAVIYIVSGGQATAAFYTTAQPGGTLGVTAMNWYNLSFSSSYTAGTGLTLTGTQFSITNTGVTAASVGSASKTLTATVNAQGQLTALADTNIAIAGSQITSGTTGTGNVVLATSPTLVTPNLGTPTTLVGTNITGTASGLSIGGNAATATTAGTASTATTATNLAGGATGSLPYQSGASATTFLSAGSNGQVLTLALGVPSWATPSSGTVTSVSGAGTVNGLTLTGTVTTSGSLTLGGTLDLSSPPTIGNTTPNTGAFTTLNATTVTSTGDSSFNGLTVGHGGGNVSNNTVLGVTALNANTTGQQNTAIGINALTTTTTANNQTAVGYQALRLSTASDNTAVGSTALQTNSTGSANTAMGFQALTANTTGGSNTAIGRHALITNSTGSNITALGNHAGAYETGSNALYIDAYDRTNTAGDKAGALLYGTFNATPSSQTLTINGAVTIPYPFRIDSTLSLAGSTGTAGYVLTSNGASAPTWQANASGLAITDDTTTNATRYLTFTSVSTGSITGADVSSTKLAFNPSSGILTTTGLAGALNGSVGATTPSTGAFTTLSANSTTTISGASTFSATATFNGSSSTLAAVFQDAAEVVTVSATAATGTINYDVTTQSVLYYTSNASANWTVNFRGSSGTSLNTLMSTGQAVTVVFLVTQGSTAYYNNAVQIDGTSVTPKYQGGTAPTSGNASGIDAYSYTIVKTGSAAFTVFASQTQFK
jgi:hypothetical protein